MMSLSKLSLDATLLETRNANGEWVNAVGVVENSMIEHVLANQQFVELMNSGQVARVRDHGKLNEYGGFSSQNLTVREYEFRFSSPCK
jgi:hypothetical protein